MPPDYQNNPPTTTDVPKSKEETPGGHGMGQAPAEPDPSVGVEGKSAPYQPAPPPLTGTTDTSGTVTDRAPVTTTT